jgi:hypothetical protein
MVIKLKSWWNNLKYYDKVFFIFFTPAMLFTFWGISDLYINYFDELTRQDHMQFFLRIFFPISLGLLITSLERRKRLKLIKDIKNYLDK